MRVGVVDVGSNTIRLLVARVDAGTLDVLDKGRVRLALGREIEQSGSVSQTSVATAAKAVARLCAVARSHRVHALDVFLTAPGRQSENAGELVAAVRRAARHDVRVLSKEEEGMLAYRGAVATVGAPLPAAVAVCDVGGASTEIAVGDPRATPSWIESVDLGSVRLSARVRDLGAARSEAAAALSGLMPPHVECALAVGGSARAARRLVGPWLGEDELAEALRIVGSNDPRAISRTFGVHRTRAEILPAGVALLAEVQRMLEAPLHVCDGGIREGAVLQTAASLAA